MIEAEDIRPHVDLGAGREGELTAIAAAVVGLWERRVRRLWARRVAYEFHAELDHLDDQYVWLPLYPVEALQVWSWPPGEAYGGAGTQLVDPASYRVVSQRGRVERLATMPTWLGYDVRMLITGGYTRVTSPPEVRDAMVVQAKFSVSRNAKNVVHMSSQGFQQSTTSFLDPTLHPQLDAVAGAYERHV